MPAATTKTLWAAEAGKPPVAAEGLQVRGNVVWEAAAEDAQGAQQ